MRRVALIIGLTAALVPAGCTVKVGGKTLGLGSGDKDEKKPEGGGAGESSGGASGGSGGGAVAPPPKLGSIEKGKAPPWCGDYQPSSSDSNKHWVKSYVEREGYGSYKTLNYLAKAACDKPGDAEREKEIAGYKQGFQAEFGATDADFVQAMALYIKEADALDAVQKEQCAALPPAAEGMADEERALAQAQLYFFGCAREPGDDVFFWLDRAQPTEIQRLTLVDRCLTGRDPRTEQGDRVANTFALCLPDMRKVDRGKLEKELGGLKLNAYGRVTAIMSFGSIKAKSAFLVAKWDGLAQKDEDWKRLLAAPDAGAKAWHQDFEAHKAAFAAVAQFEANAAKGSKKALTGCAAPLRKLFIDYLAGRKVKSIEEARSLDAVAYPLAVALMRCDVAEGRFLAASTAHGLFFANNATREQRGPRHAGYYATLAVLNEILADREKFPLDRLPYLPGTGRKVVEKAYSETFNQVSYDKAEGQIDKVKPGKETATVTFKTVKWKEPTYKCKRTNRIARIDSDGNIQYEENCKVTGHETKTSTESPVEVPLGSVDRRSSAGHSTVR